MCAPARAALQRDHQAMTMTAEERIKQLKERACVNCKHHEQKNNMMHLCNNPAFYWLSMDPVTGVTYGVSCGTLRDYETAGCGKLGNKFEPKEPYSPDTAKLA